MTIYEKIIVILTNVIVAIVPLSISGFFGYLAVTVCIVNPMCIRTVIIAIALGSMGMSIMMSMIMIFRTGNRLLRKEKES